jgi:hypothetical protein
MIMSQCSPPKVLMVRGTTLVNNTGYEGDGVLPIPGEGDDLSRVRLRCRDHDWVKRSSTHLTRSLDQVYGAA